MSEVCEAFHANPTRNPLTDRYIEIGSDTYSYLVRECGEPDPRVVKHLSRRVPPLTRHPIPTRHVRPGFPRTPSATRPISSTRFPRIPDAGLASARRPIPTRHPISSTRFPRIPDAESAIPPRSIPTRHVQPGLPRTPSATRPIPTTRAPPEFMQPSTTTCEGYWSPDYQPIPSTSVWEGKEEWIRKAKAIEESFQNDIDHHINYRGLSSSRLEPGVSVGSDEYIDDEYMDDEICWPGGYVDHYIDKHNVPPTKRFYDYINQRYAQLTTTNR